jgi:hypothetical protein
MCLLVRLAWSSAPTPPSFWLGSATGMQVASPVRTSWAFVRAFGTCEALAWKHYRNTSCLRIAAIIGTKCLDERDHRSMSFEPMQRNADSPPNMLHPGTAQIKCAHCEASASPPLPKG